MHDNPVPPKGHYFIDAESATEMARLTKQDRFFTEAMGGLFSERADLATVQSILDLGCGPGQWALDVAFAYSHIEVVGMDISETMVHYANARARSQLLSNASFEVGDITQPLDFPDNSFDLINGRLIAFLTPQQWTHLLQECKRILRPGGTLRLTENESVFTSPATDALFSLFYRAQAKAGQSFSPAGRTLGITPRLNYLLRQGGYTNVQYKAHALDYSAGNPNHEVMSEVMSLFLTLMRPFLVGMGVTTPEEVEQLLYQMNIEMYQEDFCALLYLLTVWGNKPAE